MPELAATLTTDEHGERVGHEELPPFIQTQADLDRWRLCLGIAERMTGQHESTQDVWHASRVLFFSDIPTVSQDSVFRLQGGEEIEEARPRRKQRRNRLGRWIDMPELIDKASDNEGGGERMARVVLDAVGIDPYDVDIAKLAAHAADHEKNPVSRLSIGSPCARVREIDFAVHRWLPAMMEEKYPEMARRLLDTSPRWGRAHGTVPVPVTVEESLLIEEARRRPQRRDRLGQYADMPNIPKPVLPKRTLRRSGRSAPSSPGSGQLDLIDDAGLNEWPKQTDLARTVLAGHAFTYERWMLKKQPPASPGYDPVRHPLYKARRGRTHRRIIGRQLALAVEPLLGADHPTTVKLRRGGLPTTAEKEEVRSAAARARGGAKPQALLLGGGPASGKTTVLNNNPELKPKFSVEVDPDAIKRRLSEYQKLVRAKDRYAAMAVHRESGDIAARLYDEATDLGLNVVVDGTGDAEPGAFLADLRRARQSGYEVEVVYVNRSTEESIALAIRRAEEEGRWVPLPVLRAQHAAVSRNFRDEISHQDWLTINVYDAEGHVAAITHGRTDIFNRRRFEEFIVKAEED